jgi:hypothetical protein
LIGEFDPAKLVYPWRHSDAAIDSLADEISQIVADAEKKKESRSETFERIWEVAARLQEFHRPRVRKSAPLRPVPFLSEPWYC